MQELEQLEVELKEAHQSAAESAEAIKSQTEREDEPGRTNSNSSEGDRQPYSTIDTTPGTSGREGSSHQPVKVSACKI